MKSVLSTSGLGKQPEIFSRSGSNDSVNSMKANPADVQMFLLTGANAFELLSRVTRTQVDDKVAAVVCPLLRDPRVGEVLADLITKAGDKKLTALDVLRALVVLIPVNAAPASKEVSL